MEGRTGLGRRGVAQARIVDRDKFEFKPIRELGDVLAEEDNELTGGTDSLWTTI